MTTEAEYLIIYFILFTFSDFFHHFSYRFSGHFFQLTNTKALKGNGKKSYIQCIAKLEYFPTFVCLLRKPHDWGSNAVNYVKDSNKHPLQIDGFCAFTGEDYIFLFGVNCDTITPWFAKYQLNLRTIVLTLTWNNGHVPQPQCSVFGAN